MKGKGKAFFIILAIFSALFFISNLSQAAVTPECPTGYTYNTANSRCEMDPPCYGGSFDAAGNMCKSEANYACSSGYSFNNSAYQCEMDPQCSGGSYDSTANACMTTPNCSSGYTFNGSTGVCETNPTCPCGSYDSAANYCIFSANPIYDAQGNIIGYSCTCNGSNIGSGMCAVGAQCPDGGGLNGTTDKCSKGAICPSGFSRSGLDKCLQGAQCPGGGSFYGPIDKCIKSAVITCPSGYLYNWTYHACIQGVQCPAGGSFFGGTVDKCVTNPYPTADVNLNDKCPTTKCKNEVCVGKPVSIASGTVYTSETDFTINGVMPISFTRYYNNKSTTYFRSSGYMWANNFDTKVQASNNIYKIINPDGSITYYSNKYGINIYEADFPRGETSKLIKNTDNTFKRIYKDGSSEEFNTSGYLTAVIDKNGNKLTLTKGTGNTANKLTKITDPAGREINITSNTYNLITQITLPDAKTITYTYLGGILLQKITYSDGTYKTYEYSGNNLTGIKNEKGNYIEKHTYDSQGRGITSSADGTNDLLTINYTNDTQTTVTDSLGRVTTYTYDKSKGKGHLISRTGPGCQSCGQGNVAYTYDDKLNVTTETDANGNVTAYTYDASASGGGNLLTKTEASGTGLQRTTTYTYNSLNDLLEQTYPDGTKTKYQYDAKRNLIKVQILNSSLEVLSQITFTRNTKGQITQVIDTQNNTTNIAYDTYGNITSTTDALNNTTTYTYDIMGKPLTATDANGKTTTLTYDQRARLIQTKDSLNNITAYTYDQAGSLITLTDAKTNATTFQYDLLGRLTKQTDPMAKQTTYTYDTQGNLTSKTDPLTNTIQYTYDALNRLIQKTYPDASASGGTTTYQYDAIGNLTSASNQYISYTFAYDALGRMTSVTDSLGKSISYAYDANSNRTSMTSPIGTTSYVYNALNQLTQLVQGTKTFGFAYDSLGRRTSLSMPNGTTTSYSYDSLSRLTNLSTLNSALQSINSNIYSYDSVGNKLSKQDSVGTHNYTYDNTYQLIQSTLPNETFTYDAVGNRTNTTVDAANKLLQDSNATYQYDNNGNRYIKTQTDGTVVYYSYDYEGRLTRVETQKPGLTTVAVYKYDALGRRIEKAVTENSVTTTTRYLYDNEDIIAEYDANGNITTKYIHGLGIDEPLAMEKNSSTYYYHADGLGSVVALSDSTGVVVQKYNYDSFGNITSTLNPNFIQPYTFTGREYDPETGLYHYRLRTYDQKTGTFTQKDPIGFAGGDTNLYRYVGNSPINYTDPFGLICTYSQSSGFTMCTDDTTSKVYYMDFGYSGSMSGYGYNNPDMQGEKSIGPITKGKWKMEGNWYTHPKLGKNTMKLVPLADNECSKTNRSCDTFRMHGDNPKKMGYASEGCIVLPPSRTKIKKGEIIEVIE